MKTTLFALAVTSLMSGLLMQASAASVSQPDSVIFRAERPEKVEKPEKKEKLGALDNAPVGVA